MPAEPFFPPDGIATFARAPLLRPGDPAGAEVVVIGVPWDGGTGLRGGARHGPRAIREASLRFPLWADGRPSGYWDVTSGQPRLAGVRVVDCGDIAVVRASQEHTLAVITTAARAARRSGGLLLTLGGDHSITFPLVRAFDDIPNLGIVQLDAHLDFAMRCRACRSAAVHRSGALANCRLWGQWRRSGCAGCAPIRSRLPPRKRAATR